MEISSITNHEGPENFFKETRIKEAGKESKRKGFTIVPYRLYITDRGFAKVEIALARGKKSYDKRESIKQRDQKRELDRIKKIKF
ncbi:MAG: SsrA-binding protein [Saprospiraceae bacterium]